MNFFKYKNFIRHLTIKTNHYTHNELVKLKHQCFWTLKRPLNNKVSSYFPYFLFTYYYWQILLNFQSNSKKIYINKLEKSINILTLINLNSPTNTFKLKRLNNKIYTRFFNNTNYNLTNILSNLNSTIYNKYITNNKLNFELNINSKFNLKKLFWFDTNFKIKSKYLFSKLNLI